MFPASWILAIPAARWSLRSGRLGPKIFGTFLAFSFFFWIITVVKGRMPDSIFGATATVVRFQARTYGYFFMLTSVYPGGALGDTGADGRPVEVAVSNDVEGKPLVQVPGGVDVRRRSAGSRRTWQDRPAG